MRGVQNLEGGVAENGDFRQKGHYPWVILALRVTGIVPLLLSDPSTERLMNGPSPNKDSSGLSIPKEEKMSKGGRSSGVQQPTRYELTKSAALNFKRLYWLLPLP